MGAARDIPLSNNAATRASAAAASSQTGRASMFPGERPGGIVPKPPGFEESTYRRGEVTRERDRTGRRAEIYDNFVRAQDERSTGAPQIAPGGAVERGAGLFGAPLGGAGTGLPTGTVFGPGRAGRTPEPGSPEYSALVERMRSLGRR